MRAKEAQQIRAWDTRIEDRNWRRGGSTGRREWGKLGDESRIMASRMYILREGMGVAVAQEARETTTSGMGKERRVKFY